MKHPHYLIIAAAILLPTITSAADSKDFTAAAAKSAEKFKTSVGGQYGTAFLHSTGAFVGPAIQACAYGQFPIGSTYDVVFIVSASGRIERMIPGKSSPYGDCVASYLSELRSAEKPPSGSWPIHIRFLHGRQARTGPQPVFMVVSDDAGAQR